MNRFVNEGKIAYLLKTKVIDIITDDSGAVIGVKAESADGEQSYYAKAVILCSGGFANNAGKLDQMYKRYGSSSGGFSIGNMFDVAEALGADTYSMDITRLDGGMLPLSDKNGVNVELEMAVSTNGYVWLNKEGKRVCNENTGIIFDKWDAWRHAEDNTLYVLFDQSLLDQNTIFYIGNYATNVKDEGNVRFFEELDKGEHIWKGDTIEEVAEKAGIDPAQAAATIEAYNSYCKNGEDPEFNRKAEGLIELNGPFYLVETIASVKGSLGGLVINPQTQVLKKDGTAIPNLYAAGEIVGDIASTGHSWFNGVCLVLCTSYGQIAGENAAAEALN